MSYLNYSMCRDVQDLYMGFTQAKIYRMRVLYCKGGVRGYESQCQWGLVNKASCRWETLFLCCEVLVLMQRSLLPEGVSVYAEGGRGQPQSFLLTSESWRRTWAATCLLSKHTTNYII